MTTGSGKVQFANLPGGLKIRSSTKPNKTLYPVRPVPSPKRRKLSRMDSL